MSLSNNNFNIYINIFIHYPEAYNSTVINRKINLYFNDLLSENKSLNSTFSGNTYVMINSAPHNENQILEIDFNFSNEIDESLKNSKKLLECKDYLSSYFGGKIKEIYIKFTK